MFFFSFFFYLSLSPGFLFCIFFYFFFIFCSGRIASFLDAKYDNLCNLPSRPEK